MHLPVSHKMMAWAVLEKVSTSGRKWDRIESDCVRCDVCWQNCCCEMCWAACSTSHSAKWEMTLRMLIR